MLDEFEEAENKLVESRLFSKTPPDKNSISYFIFYPLLLEALLKQEQPKMNEYFEALVEAHKVICKSKKYSFCPYFHDSPDENIFFWGVGLANLCRYKGFDVRSEDPLVPDELLIEVKRQI